MKPLEVWTCQRAENLKKKLAKIPKNYAATMVSAARPQIVGGGAARPAHGSTFNTYVGYTGAYHN